MFFLLFYSFGFVYINETGQEVVYKDEALVCIDGMCLGLDEFYLSIYLYINLYSAPSR